MKRFKLTCVPASTGLLLALGVGCSQVDAPAPVINTQATTAQPNDAAAPPRARQEDESDASDGAADDKLGRRSENLARRIDRPSAKSSDAGRAKGDAGDGGDAGKRDAGKPDAGKRADAGDAGPAECAHSEAENDLTDCEQFETDECELPYAVERCQAFHLLMDANVFEAFVACVADTPGLDLCGEDKSTVDTCAAEALPKACQTHQPACEAYEGCESMSVDECDKAVTIYSTSAIELGQDLYECGTDPTYFFQ